MRSLADHIAIQQTMARYCRGVDRLDRGLIEGAYWPDAHDDHVVFAGSPKAFADWVIEHLGKARATFHMLGQSLVVLDGDRAAVETYYQAATHATGPAGESLRISVGRYLDTFERRGEEWRILERKVLVDVGREEALPASAGAQFDDPPHWLGRHGPEDPSYRLAALKAP